MKKLAIVLAGLHYAPEYRDWHFADVTDIVNPVDFRQYVKSIKTSLYDYYNKKGYEIDTFISTSESPIQDEMIRTYMPKLVQYTNKTSRFYKIVQIFDILYHLVINNEVTYDYVCFTRFDIYFMKNFDNIIEDKFNIISVLEKDNLIDDNFYFFPIKYLESFVNVLHQIENNCLLSNRLILHHAKDLYHKTFDVNYICNEHDQVPHLSFFKLRFFDNIEFIINKYLFSENYWYDSVGKTAKFLINGNTTTMSKISESYCRNASIGYQIRIPGKYQLSFDIKSDRNIIGFEFIKLQKSGAFFATPNVIAGQKSHVEIIITVTDRDDTMYFIFDMFRGRINVEFSNIDVYRLVEITDSGIIINRLNLDEKSIFYNNNGISLKCISNNEFEILKHRTKNVMPFLWFGYEILSHCSDIMMSFDIKFIDCIPQPNKLFSVKTHIPTEHYSDWLNECKLDEFVHIQIPIHVKEIQQLILFILDEYLKEAHFLIKNINLVPLTEKLKRCIVKKPRIAILMAGEMRNFDNKDLIAMNNKYLFDMYDCDIFISTWDKRGSSTYNGTIDTKQYTETDITKDQLQKVYKNIKNIHIENFDNWLQTIPEEYKKIYDKGLLVPWSGKIIKCSIFPQFYKIWDANNMKKQYECENNFKYDIVMRFRSDLWLVDPIPLTYLHEFLTSQCTFNKIWTSNPPKIFYPKRVYDIFFYGDSDTMNKLCDAWKNIIVLINHNFDNGLLDVDSCRSLYVQCLLNDIKVIDILKCIGDVYRDEKTEDYVNKIKNKFN